MAKVQLEFQGLVSGRSGSALHKPLTVGIDATKALIIRGPNGIGKSTLLRTLAGFLSAIEGHATYGGFGTDQPDGLQEICALCGHKDRLKDHLTIGENLEFWACYYSGSLPDDALGAVGLGDLSDQRVASCSAGQRKRLSLAVQRVSGRPVWLLDEPTSSLDVDGVSMLKDLVAEHLGKGHIAVIVTHDADIFTEFQTVTLEPAANTRSSDPFLEDAFA